MKGECHNPWGFAARRARDASGRSYGLAGEGGSGFESDNCSSIGQRLSEYQKSCPHGMEENPFYLLRGIRNPCPPYAM